MPAPRLAGVNAAQALDHRQVNQPGDRGGVVRHHVGFREHPERHRAQGEERQAQPPDAHRPGQRQQNPGQRRPQEERAQLFELLDAGG